MLALICEVNYESRTFRQKVAIDSGDCGSGFARLFCEYCALSCRTPSKEDEDKLDGLMTKLLLDI